MVYKKNSKSDYEWLRMIHQENERFENNSKYLVGKFLVYVNQFGVFTKQITDVWGHNECDYVLEFSDGSRVYIEISDMEHLIEDKQLDDTMWLFERDDEIQIDKVIQNDYMDTLDEIKKCEEHMKELKSKLDNLKKCLVKQCGM